MKEDRCDIEENKLRINTSTGQQSVLFEDISSLGYEVASREVPNPKLKIGLIISLVTGVLMVAIIMNGEFLMGCGVAVVGFIIAAFFMVQKTVYFDQINVETRGGKVIHYGMPENKGQEEVDRIEKAKREAKK